MSACGTKSALEELSGRDNQWMSLWLHLTAVCIVDSKKRPRKELQKKPCTSASFPESRVLNIQGKKFDLLERFPRSLLSLPEEIINLLVERYGIEQVQNIVRWCHPGGKLDAKTGASNSHSLGGPVEAVSDTELGASPSGTPMEVEAEP